MTLAVVGCKPDYVATEPVFDPKAVPVFRLEFDDRDWEGQLEAAFDPTGCDDRTYVPATLVYENPMTGEKEEWEDVGVRYRGHNIYDEQNRQGFKISFDEFVEDRSFHSGLDKINLLGTEGDPTLLHERLALQMARDLGIPAPRVNHAVLYVDGTYMGVFPNSEEADDSAYLANHFEVDSGSLYKVKGYCGYRARLEYDGETTEELIETYEPKAGTDPVDMEADLVPFLQCASSLDDGTFRDCIEQWIDVEEWLREIAMDVTLPDVDGMAGAGQNFLLYFDPSIQRFVVYPWDKDLAFFTNTVNASGGTIWSLYPEWLEGSTPELVDRLRTVYREEYCAAVQEAAALYDPEAVVPRIDELEELLDPHIRRDPFLERGAWKSALEELRETVRTRHPAVVAQATECEP